MTNQVFWELISSSREHGVKQVEWLIEELSKKTVEDIIGFEMEFNDKLRHSYTSSLWGAAYLLLGGCSDDGFDYFRTWLIAQGEDVFLKAIENPESLNDYLTDEYLETEEYGLQMEEMMYVAKDAYTYKITGKTEYDDDAADQFYAALDASGEKYEILDIDIDWEEDDLETMFPILWERFGENPL